MERANLIGFDGLHRTGKGTQAELLEEFLREQGYRVATMRGDGSRPGEGIVSGDDFSIEWQQRCLELRGAGNTADAWNRAGAMLVEELVDRRDAGTEDFILVDRTVISRALFVYDRIGEPAGERYTHAELYPTVDEHALDALVDSSLPATIFHFYTADLDVLLGRLDEADPKFGFRSRNITSLHEPAGRIVDLVPPNAGATITDVDPGRSIAEIHEEVREHTRALFNL